MLNHISDAQLSRMYWDEGLSGKEIAAALSCSPSAVCQRMKASGIPARSPHDYPPTEKQKKTWKDNGKRLANSPNLNRTGRAPGFRKRSDYEFGGHEKKRSDGYIKVYVPDHPHATADGYVMKHTLVMEREIGRYLTSDEVVHHINHVRDDNSLSNLRLMTKKEHMSLHMQERHAERRARSC